MSLNTIKFEPNEIASLYKSTLVEINSEKATTLPSSNIPIQTAGWKYLGENKKKILVVVRYTEAVNIPDKHLSFLTKLLAACHLNLADVAVLNFQDHRSSELNEILKYFRPNVVLLFDVEPGEFGLPMIFPQFQVQAYKDTIFVASPSLETIEPDKTLKGKLWACLKKIFNL